MFLDVTMRRNPALIEAAVKLHQRGDIPANCYVIDVDTVAANARLVAEGAAAHGLKTYQMTKQFGRNPIVAKAIAEAGIGGVVAVDFEEARVLYKSGLRMGHLGHLVQVPAREAQLAVEMAPEFITVFGVPQAEAISRAAVAAGTVQPVQIRVSREGDVYYPAQKGGVPIEDLLEAAAAVDALDGVRVAGVTSFPCLLWDETDQEFRPTPNLTTVTRAAELLRANGFTDVQAINAPSASCLATFEVLARNGATHVEPGSCLTGQTPLHAVSDQPELPAMIYVSEITHQTAEATYALGGGFYPRSKARNAVIYPKSGGEPVSATVELDPPDAIDYYGTLHVTGPGEVSVGDTVVYAFRSQVFVSRCFVAVIGGVATTPQVLGIFDRDGFVLGPDLLPPAQPSSGVSALDTRARVGAV
ncbi:alanine racemase [Arthrobacter sp. KN11-1C]|uniref:alanine racemase n=1 Tax=Arthrobacter sp. KN11-1C TaxID=3445774 RepID=UPI003FA031EB